jgi:sugar lactone lactonase YvrE
MRGVRARLAVLLLALGLPAAPAAAHEGRGIAADAERRVLYFTDNLRNIVWKLDAAGRRSVFATGVHTNNLILDAAGNLYADHFTSHLLRFTPDGRREEVLSPAERQRRLGEFAPFLQVDRAGNLYFLAAHAADPNAPVVARLSPEGEVTPVVSGTWRAGLHAAQWGPDGSLYVAHEHAISRISPEGKISLLAGGSAPGFQDGAGGLARFDRPLGLAFDARGRLYVADSGNAHVRVVLPDGRVEIAAHSRWYAPPRGVAVLDGAAYVLEDLYLPLPGFAGPRVRRLRGHDAETVTTVWAWSRPGAIYAGLALGAVLGAAAVFLAGRSLWRMRQRALRSQPVA